MQESAAGRQSLSQDGWARFSYTRTTCQWEPGPQPLSPEFLFHQEFGQWCSAPLPLRAAGREQQPPKWPGCPRAVGSHLAWSQFGELLPQDPRTPLLTPTKLSSWLTMARNRGGRGAIRRAPESVIDYLEANSEAWHIPRMRPPKPLQGF